MKPTVILASPLKGCVSGIEAVTRMTLDSPLSERWNLIHLDTATARSNAERGRPNLHSTKAMLRHMLSLRSLIRQHKPQAIIIQAGQNRAAFMKYALLESCIRRDGPPIVAKFGGGGFRHWFSVLGITKQNIVRSALRRASILLVEAKVLREQFRDIAPMEKVRWAYLGIDPGEWRVLPQRPEPDDMWSLLYIGHVSKEKGAFDAIAALPIIQREIPACRLILVGENVSGVQVSQSNCHELGIVTGPYQHSLFEHSDVFVFPSHSEGFPVAVLEAMASGLPIVCSPVGALPEILDSFYCRFVAAKNPEQLAGAVVDLLRDYKARMCMGNRVRALVEEKFTLKHYADGMERALGDLL